MAEVFRIKLSQCPEKREDGSLRMTIALPDESVLNNIARSLARIAGG